MAVGQFLRRRAAAEAQRRRNVADGVSKISFFFYYLSPKLTLLLTLVGMMVFLFTQGTIMLSNLIKLMLVLGLFK